MPLAKLLLEMFLPRRGFLKAGAAALLAAPLAKSQPQPEIPKLLVLLTAAQFRPDYLDRLWLAFGSGGFRRLIGAGAYLPNARMACSTFTASGIATLLTGAWPAIHGIVADRWLQDGTPVSASPGQNLAGSLFDEILRDPRNRVFAIGEALASIAKPEVTTFVPSSNGWKCSRSPVPEWFDGFAAARAPAGFAGAEWRAVGGRPGTPPVRVLSAGPGLAATYNASPYGLSSEFALARELVTSDHAGKWHGLDVIALSLDALGELGSQTGADSPVMNDLVLHLDLQLASFLDILDERLGRSNFAVAFTAAHGLPGSKPLRAIDGERIALASQGSAYLYPFLYLAPGSTNLSRRAAAESAVAVGDVAAYYTASGDCSHTGELRERFERSFHRSRSGDVMFSYRPQSGESAAAYSSGSLYNHDTRIPMLFYGPLFSATTIEDTALAVDFAPTLARACGIAPPDSSGGRVLGDVFRSAH